MQRFFIFVRTAPGKAQTVGIALARKKIEYIKDISSIAASGICCSGPKSTIAGISLRTSFRKLSMSRICKNENGCRLCRLRSRRLHSG